MRDPYNRLEKSRSWFPYRVDSVPADMVGYDRIYLPEAHGFLRELNIYWGRQKSRSGSTGLIPLAKQLVIRRPQSYHSWKP